MSEIKPPSPVKLIASIFSKDELTIADAVDQMVTHWGMVDFMSAILLFNQTDYYAKEFGSPLLRRFISFERLVDPVSLPDIKHRTNRLESESSTGGKRHVNIDPGYITAERVVLATGKNYSHRIYLGAGVYADLTLIYTKGGYQRLPWTYPDYASTTVNEILEQIRRKYLFQVGIKQDGNL